MEQKVRLWHFYLCPLSHCGNHPCSGAFPFSAWDDRHAPLSQPCSMMSPRLTLYFPPSWPMCLPPCPECTRWFKEEYIYIYTYTWRRSLECSLGSSLLSENMVTTQVESITLINSPRCARCQRASIMLQVGTVSDTHLPIHPSMHHPINGRGEAVLPHGPVMQHTRQPLPLSHQTSTQSHEKGYLVATELGRECG